MVTMGLILLAVGLVTRLLPATVAGAAIIVFGIVISICEKRGREITARTQFFGMLGVLILAAVMIAVHP